MCNKVKYVSVLCNSPARACKIVAALLYFIAHETRPAIIQNKTFILSYFIAALV